MNNSAKQRLINSILYIVLALIAVAIMCVTIFAFATAANKKTPIAEEIEQITEEKQTEIKTVKQEKTKDTEKQPNTKDTAAISPDTEPISPVSVDDLEFKAPSNGHVSKAYSDELAVYSLTMNDYRVHSGTDFAASIGSPVYACADGCVTEIYDSVFMGKCVVVDHGFGLKSYYMNLSDELPLDIYEGAEVSAGDTIAAVGDTALLECADAEHLHFEMKLNDKNVDPMKYIEPVSSVAAEAEYED